MLFSLEINCPQGRAVFQSIVQQEPSLLFPAAQVIQEHTSGSQKHSYITGGRVTLTSS